MSDLYSKQRPVAQRRQRNGNTPRLHLALELLESRLMLSAAFLTPPVVTITPPALERGGTPTLLGVATQIVFTTQPANTTSTALKTVTLAVEDDAGNIITTDTSTITIALAAGHPGVTLGGTLSQTAINGVATFGDLNLTSAGTFSLQATDGSFGPVTSTSFSVSFVVIPEYRLYLATTAEHLYTTDANEYATLATRGWSQEGVAYNVYTGPAVVSDIAAVPYYRLYNSKILQHLWTTDLNEYNTLAGRGWTQEGINSYLFAASSTPITGTPVPNSQPLYRLNLNTKASDFHLWTTDLNEYTTLASKYGWTQEGIIGYVLTQATT